MRRLKGRRARRKPAQEEFHADARSSQFESKLWFLSTFLSVERRQGDSKQPHWMFEREHRGKQGPSYLQNHVDTRNGSRHSSAARCQAESEYLIFTVTVLPVTLCASQ